MMPVFRVQMPDGRVARIQADTGDAALAYARSLPGKSPAPPPQAPGASQGKSRSPADQATYLRELAKERAANAANPQPTTGFLGKLNSFAAGEMAPITGEIIGGLHAGGNAVANLFRPDDQKTSSRAVYEAVRDATDEGVGQVLRANPVSSGAGSVAGLLTAGGEVSKGAGLLKGLAAAKVAKNAPEVAAAARSLGTATGDAASALKAAASKVVKPQILDYGGKVAKAAGTGAVGGAALGATSGTSLDERLQNAEKGAEGGAIGGGLLQGVGAPVLAKTGAVLGDVGRGIAAAVMPEGAKLGSGGQAADAARRAVVNLARIGGVTADNLAAKTAPYQGLDQTAAEAMGTSGQNMLAALSRRQGTTGDALRTQMRMRAVGQPGGILEDFKTRLGVDPAAAQGNVDALVKQGKDAAGDLFRQAYANSAEGVNDPEVDRLLQTPLGQRLMAGIQRRALNIGRPSEALTYGDVEVPRGGVQVNPGAGMGPGDTITPDSLTVRRAPSAPPRSGMSLSQWVAKRGGMSGRGAVEAPEDVPVSKGFGLVSRPTGQTDEQLSQAAWEAGYFPDHPEAPTPQEFQRYLVRDALARPGTPGRLYAQEQPEAAMQRYQGANADEEAIARGYGDAPPPSEDDYGNLPPPEYEPALQRSLTGEALDRIRRRANAMVERDPITRQPIRTGDVGLRNEEPIAWSQDFTRALAGEPDSTGGAVRGLREALDQSSDYLGIQSAQNAVKGKLLTGTLPEFQRAWATLKPGAETFAGQAQMANDVMDLWGRGLLKGGKFSNPAIRLKLQHAFGDAAQPFIDQMERRAELAASGARMAPFSGSPTMTLQQAADAADNAGDVGDFVGVGAKLAKGNILGAVAHGLGKLGAYSKTAGQDEAFRNELGRILALPSDDPEFRAILQGAQDQPYDADTLARMGLGRDWPSRFGAAAAVRAAGPQSQTAP